MKQIARVVARLALAAGAAAAVGRGLTAQQPAGELSAAAWGYVADQFAQPVVGAEVLLVKPDRTVTARTVDAGAYRLDSLAPGSHQLRVRRLGYLPLSTTVEVKGGDMTARDLTIVKLPFALDPALVQTPDGELRANFADFAARRALGRGAFLDREGIDALHPSTVTDLMRAVKSFRVLSAGNGSYRLVSSSSGPDAACTVRYLVDGFPYSPTDGLNDFDPEHIGALEAYGPGEAPQPLEQASGNCGTVVIWLRR